MPTLQEILAQKKLEIELPTEPIELENAVDLSPTLFYLRYKKRIRCFQDFRTLAEWLECYHYVLPKHRTLMTSLIPAVMKDCVTSADVRLMWEVLDCAQVNLPVDGQLEFLNLIEKDVEDG